MDHMDTQTITILLGFAALVAGQGATLLTLIIRGDRQQKENDRRFEEINRRFDTMNDDVNKRFDDVNKRFDDVNKRFDDVNKRFDDVNKRFDETIREIADQRERMARLEGSLDGFLAGRRDRDAA